MGDRERRRLERRWRTCSTSSPIIGFRPGNDSMLLLSALFGVGAALTLDEFALILHLDDVYWTAEGRSSIEATLMGAAFAVLCLLATAPLGSDPRHDLPHWLVAGIVLADLSFVLVAFLKGKAKLGALGVFLPPVAIVAAARLGKPTSPWARRFYRDRKLERSRSRAALHDRRYRHIRHRLYDVIGGSPHLQHQPRHMSTTDTPTGHA
jgi:hypothetical protein